MEMLSSKQRLLSQPPKAGCQRVCPLTERQLHLEPQDILTVKQRASLSLFTFISSAFVLFFHFNFKTLMDHSGGQVGRSRDGDTISLSLSSLGWQEVGTLEASTICVCACVWGGGRANSGRDDRREGRGGQPFWRCACPPPRGKRWVSLAGAGANRTTG